MSEKQLQAKVIRWLRHQGAYVIKTQPGAGTPVGCPDIVGFKEGFWFALEIKASEKSKYQPLQQTTIAKLDDWSYAKVVYESNWQEIKKELQGIL